MDDQTKQILEELEKRDRRIVKALAIFGLSAAIAVLGFLIVAQAFAAPTMRLTHARGLNALPRAQTYALADRAVKELCAETGVCIKILRRESVANPFQNMHRDMSNAIGLLDLWGDWFNRRGSKADIRYAAVPPFKEGGMYWMLGYAWHCTRRGAAYSTVEARNQDGAYRVPHAYIAMKHEIAHVLGAYHDNNSCNLMNCGAMFCVPKTATLAGTVAQIRDCSGGW